MTESTSESSTSLIRCSPSFCSPSMAGHDCFSGCSPSAAKMRCRFCTCCRVSWWWCCKFFFSFGSEALSWSSSSISRMVSSIVKAAPSLWTNNSVGVPTVANVTPLSVRMSNRRATRARAGQTRRGRNLRATVGSGRVNAPWGRRWGPILALWLALGAGLAALTTQVVDWYVMTDELFYERLAISVGKLGSPFPHIHGQLVGNVNQLYPLLLAPLFDGRLVPSGLRDAHLLNAFVMSSACVPAFLLARRVTQNSRVAYVVAGLSVCIPWIALASFLMTEAVAYPVFLWADLALPKAAVSPRPRNDVFVLVTLAAAVLARTQLATLLVVVPLALLLDRFSLRKLWSSHRVLALAYAAVRLVAIVLLVLGELSRVVGNYSVTTEGNLVPSGMPRSLLEHLAPLGLGLGILPFILGVAWLMIPLLRERTREQHAFASVALVTIVALLLIVTSYDLRFGAGRLHDRYLFYLVPLVLIAFAAMLLEPECFFFNDTATT